MPPRGRGGSQGFITPFHPSQSRINPPELDSILHAPPAISIHEPSTEVGQSTSGGQSTATIPPIDVDQSNVVPTYDNPQSTVEPSSENSHNEVDRRLVISVQRVSNPRRFVPDSVTRDIISELLMRMPNPAPNWKSYSVDMKENLFNDFMNKYHFASTYDQSMARKIWNLTCMDRYSDALAKARKKAKEKANSDNIEDLKGFGPRSIRTEMWVGLVDIWATEEWKKKSIAGKANRAAKPDAMMHTGGSRSFGQHLKKMEEEHKRPISYGELYSKVHKKKDGEYVSNKAKNFIESYENAMIEKYGEDTSNHPIVDSDLWIKTAGENKKGRIYGIGQSLDLGISHVSSSSVEGPSSQNLTTPLTEEITTLATQISSLQEQMKTQLQAQTDMQALMQAQMKTQAEMQTLMQQQMQEEMQSFKKDLLSALKKQ